MRHALVLFFVVIVVAVGFAADEEGLASWYGGKFQGRQTASGEIFDTLKLTAAHKTLPFGTVLRVVNLENGNSTVVRINDRGPFVAGRIIDLSRAAALELEMTGKGVARVRLVLLNQAPEKRYTIQLAAYRHSGNAEAALAKLRESGFDAVLETGAGGISRLVLPDIPAGELNQMKEKLQEAGYSEMLVRAQS